jgi:hypothetical protein
VQAPDAPAKIGQYRVVRELGRGGMGVVYEALDERLERSVALKVLSPELSHDSGFRARFLREARVAAAINHPNIVTVHELGETEGKLFIAMALVHGRSLRALLQNGPLSLGEALRLGEQIAGALSAAHAAGVVHRDLKPENVIVTESGEVRLLDFGIAKALVQTPLPVDAEARTEAHAATHAGQVLGTPGYMAPEQALGAEVDARVDVFAFGVLLYEMIAGRPAFGGLPSERLAAVLRDEPPALPASGVGPELGSLLARCLAKSPEQRFADGRALLAAVASARGSSAAAVAVPVGQSARSAAAANTTAGPRPPSLPARTIPLLAVLALIAIVVGIGATWREREAVVGSAKPAPSVAPEPVRRASSRATAGARFKGPLVFPCEKADLDAGFGHGCQAADYVAWCDNDWKQVACCSPGLVPGDLDGSCVCPPGGREGRAGRRAQQSERIPALLRRGARRWFVLGAHRLRLEADAVRRRLQRQDPGVFAALSRGSALHGASVARPELSASGQRGHYRDLSVVLRALRKRRALPGPQSRLSISFSSLAESAGLTR